MPCSYLELHISKGSCSATPLKAASKFLFASTDISFYIPFTLDWNLQFYFDCSFIFALEMESLKNIGKTEPVGYLHHGKNLWMLLSTNTHLLQPGPTPKFDPTSKLGQVSRGHIS